ncbi:hypothetical protein [Micromonospora sp. CPCC 205556]|uniref:hypothetical protein n=1 Tax=Micromonospora sp. CPCC 205556 TaxID=3122398 RepID=UPI002FF11A6A
MNEAELTAAAADEAARWRRQFGVTLAMLVAFAALVVAMIWLARTDDAVWQRRVYIFGAVEAIVFTAVGWLFGREVNRSAVTTARADAEAARQEASDARAEAGEEKARASRVDSTLKAVCAATRAATAREQPGISDRGAGASRSGGSLDLGAFLQELLDPPADRPD